MGEAGIDLGGIVAHEDGDDRLVVDRADQEVVADRETVELLLRGAAGPQVVVEIKAYYRTVTFGTTGLGVGRVTYRVPDTSRSTVTLVRIE